MDEKIALIRNVDELRELLKGLYGQMPVKLMTESRGSSYGVTPMFEVKTDQNELILEIRKI